MLDEAGSDCDEEQLVIELDKFLRKCNGQIPPALKSKLAGLEQKMILEGKIVNETPQEQKDPLESMIKSKSRFKI